MFVLYLHGVTISLDVRNNFMIKISCFREKKTIEKPWQNMLHNKTIPHSKIYDTKRFKRILKFKNYPLSANLSLRCWFSVPEWQIHSRSQMFFKIGVLKNFAMFTGKHLCWPLQTFFYRAPTVVASGFSRQ